MSRFASNAILFALYGGSSSAVVLLLKLAMGRLAAQGGWSTFRTSAGILFFIGAILYASSFLLWLRLLSRLPLSSAYPVAIGLTLVLSVMLSAFWLQERLTSPRLAGIALIFAGTILLTREVP